MLGDGAPTKNVHKKLEAQLGKFIDSRLEYLLCLSKCVKDPSNTENVLGKPSADALSAIATQLRYLRYLEHETALQFVDSINKSVMLPRDADAAIEMIHAKVQLDPLDVVLPPAPSDFKQSNRRFHEYSRVAYRGRACFSRGTLATSVFKYFWTFLNL